jgi:hypothetical protein
MYNWYIPELNVSRGSSAMTRADDARMAALISSSLRISHSVEAKLCRKGLAFLSIRWRFLAKKRSSSWKALIVIIPAIDSDKWFAKSDFVVPFIRISSLAEAR